MDTSRAIDIVASKSERICPVASEWWITDTSLASEILVPLNVICLGYPEESPRPKDKWNPEKIIYVTE